MSNISFKLGIGLVAFALAAACGGDDGGGGSGGSTGVSTSSGSGTGSTSSSSGGNVSSTSSGPESTDCGEAPWDCAAGTTCGIAEDGSFACLTSGAGALGDECRSLVGKAECGDGLLCVQFSEDTPGACAPFCDPAGSEHACPGNEACLSLQLQSGSTINACDVGGIAGGGGGGAGGGTGGAGGN